MRTLSAILMSDSDRQIYERVARNEQRLDTHETILNRVTQTLDRVVRLEERQDTSRAQTTENEHDIDALRGEVQSLEAWLKNRWYVVMAILGGAVIIIDLITKFLL